MQIIDIAMLNGTGAGENNYTMLNIVPASNNHKQKGQTLLTAAAPILHKKCNIA